MNVETVLTELTKNGFQIEQIETDKFMCYDNGKFGFCSDEDPFVVDSEELLEIFETYLD